MICRNGLLLTFLTLFFSVAVIAQNRFNYEASWKKIDKLIEDNLPKSANEELDKIYKQSRKDGADAQNIKALVYKTRLVQLVEENDWFKNLRSFEKEIETAKEPAKQILHSLAADLLLQYFENQRWKLYNRTNTSGFKKEDPDTWTADDFHNEIVKHYDQSLTHHTLLQQTVLANYEPVIVKGNQRRLRPTLFDLLANNAINYFKSDEPDINKPAYAFSLNDFASLADYTTFIRYQYQSKDSNSHALKAIKIYQQLLSFHAGDANKAALVNTDIERIAFVYENTILENKEQLYKEALEHIYTQYAQLPEAMKAGYLLAAWWKQKADNYNAATGTTEDKLAYQQAILLCKEIMSKWPESEGGAMAANMLHEIQSPSLSLQTEKVNPVKEAFRVLVSFKNTSNIYLRVIPVNDSIEDLLNKSNNDNDTYWKNLAKLSFIKTWQQTVPGFSDYRNHSAEIKVDGLPAGKFILLASAKKDFSTGVNVMSSALFYVSNISFVMANKGIYVLHRNTGKPLVNARVQLWRLFYNYDQRKNARQKSVSLNTDKNGFALIPVIKQDENMYYGLVADIQYKQDHLFVNDQQIFTRQYAPNKPQVQPDDKLVKYFIYTDRSIYRPTQTVYFKAIGILPHAQNDAGKNGNSLFITANPVVVELRNTNNELVDTLKLTANEYGSIHGSFVLPAGGLTGAFSIRIRAGQESSTSFNVEEYKRPKFYAEMQPLTGTYQLNDTITATGIAKAYAGNAIDGATVKYRVKRNTRFLYPWLFWGRGKYIWPPSGGGEMEITHGETTTDAEGHFNIAFTAIPDHSINKSLDPSFDYTIEADVTDINGETRSTSNTVSVAYKSLVIDIDLAGKLHYQVDSLTQIRIAAKNLAGEKSNTAIKVQLYSLQTPQRLIRERYWEAPDTTVMSYDAFIKNFPHDEYRNESDYHAWKKQKLIATSNMESGKQDFVTLPSLPAGYYLVEAIATDKQGHEIKSINYFSLADVKNRKLPAPVYHYDAVVKNTIEPGEQAVFVEGSSANDLFVIEQTTKASDAMYEAPIVSVQYATINNGITHKTFKATEADRGGYNYNNFFVKDNRIYQTDWNINVSYSNKDLQISFETFRDKLLPGQTETWKLKITGNKGEKIAAEMLASMYDASLDQFKNHVWESLSLWQPNRFSADVDAASNFSPINSRDNVWSNYRYKNFEKNYDRLIDMPIYPPLSRLLQGRIMGMNAQMSAPAMSVEGNSSSIHDLSGDYKYTANKMAKEKDGDGVPDKPEDTNKPQTTTDNKETPVQIRKNFNETAFFLPELRTNQDGETEISFTIPEALTKWKLQTLAHTKDLATGMATKSIVTQKQLMVQPNAPRFFRQGDSIVFVTKLVNLADSSLTGNISLELFDPATMQSLNAMFGNKESSRAFTINKGSSNAYAFAFSIPKDYVGALQYRVIAKAGNTSDGEEMALPVLTNRMLVTESFPVYINGTGTKQFNWEKLLHANTNNGLQHQSLTVEYTSNPVWYAVQSLPYLIEYPYECAEQTWNRFYANALAVKIANSMPKIQAVFNNWKADSTSLLSNLQKNAELKTALLEETPWVLAAKNENEQKKNIALLFDMVRMNKEAASTIAKLQDMQSSNGGFVWFKGGPDDRYITQYIVSAIGHLQKLGAWPAAQQTALQNMVQKAIPYLDNRILEDYNQLQRSKVDMSKQQLSSIAIQYLYMRSFFNLPLSATHKTAFDYYVSQAKKYWTKQSKYEQGMIALVLHRMQDAKTPKAILQSLTENSISNDEFGMYWKEFNTGGYYWWQAPIESHALLTEAYAEIEKNNKRTDALKTWVLRQKQTQSWSSTKSTAEACYALLLDGSNWLNEETTTTIHLGDTLIAPSKTEAGTGYFKQTIDGQNVQANMGNITVQSNKTTNSKSSSAPGWGSIYWQYFSDLDQITEANTGISIKKQLFKQSNSDNGPVLTPINDNDQLQVGDKVKVRMELRSDRNLEYVHLKDMRASCFEPVDVISEYKYQGGLGYYQSTKDASSNFFISYLAKGTYVFEYTLNVTHAGNFSNGISSLQCMYAPEFSSHSQGIRVNVVTKSAGQ